MILLIFLDIGTSVGLYFIYPKYTNTTNIIVLDTKPIDKVCCYQCSTDTYPYNVLAYSILEKCCTCCSICSYEYRYITYNHSYITDIPTMSTSTDCKPKCDINNININSTITLYYIAGEYRFWNDGYIQKNLSIFWILLCAICIINIIYLSIPICILIYRRFIASKI